MKISEIKGLDRKYRPMRIVHGFAYDPKAPLEEELGQIRAQLDMLKSLGYGGVVLNVAFYDYLRSEHAWKVLEGALPLCEERDMRVWLYDEKGYPSGGAGTNVLDAHPEYEAQGVVCLSESCAPSKHVVIPKPHGHKDVLAVFAIHGSELTDEALKNRIELTDHLTKNDTLVWDATFEGRVFYIVTKYVFEGAHPARNYYDVRRYPDVLNKDAMQLFIDLTYKPYYERLGKYFGNTIEAAFTDEPSILSFYCPPLPVNVPTVHEPDPEIPLYPFVTWSRDFRETYQEVFDEDPVAKIPYLFEGDSEAARQMRCRWYEIITRMYEEAFFKPISEFCAAHDVAFSGHLLMEESILGQVMAEGDFFRQLKHMQYPGIDMLNSRPEHMLGAGAICCKTVSSVSHLYARGHVMSESSEHTQRMAGETVDKADMIGATAAQYAMGVDTITSYYGDKVLSQEDYQSWNATIARIGEAMAEGKHSAPLAVYYPSLTSWAETEPSDQDFTHFLFHGDDDRPGKGVNQTSLDCCNSFRHIGCDLLLNQLDYDMIGDEGLCASTIQSGELVTPAGEHFKALVIPFVRVMHAKTVALLKKFADEGLRIFVHRPGEVIAPFEAKDVQSDYAALLKHANVQSCEDMDALLQAVDGLRDLKAATPVPKLLYLRKTSPENDRYLLVNTASEPLTVTMTFAHAAGKAYLFNPETQSVAALGEGDTFEIAFEAKQPLIISFE